MASTGLLRLFNDSILAVELGEEQTQHRQGNNTLDSESLCRYVIDMHIQQQQSHTSAICTKHARPESIIEDATGIGKYRQDEA